MEQSSPDIQEDPKKEAKRALDEIRELKDRIYNSDLIDRNLLNSIFEFGEKNSLKILITGSQDFEANSFLNKLIEDFSFHLSRSVKSYALVYNISNKINLL